MPILGNILLHYDFCLQIGLPMRKDSEDNCMKCIHAHLLDYESSENYKHGDMQLDYNPPGRIIENQSWSKRLYISNFWISELFSARQGLKKHRF